MFLTTDELRELSGCGRKSTVLGWLDSQRIPYIVGADGWPRVSRAVICARLGESLNPKPEPRLHLA